MMSKRDVDNARLRDQREQLTAEVLERKQKECVKYASMQEYKVLAESRSASRRDINISININWSTGTYHCVGVGS